MSRPPEISVEKIVSGGQTGVDRGALDAARQLGIRHGGWCPRGRLAEDGTIPAVYQLRETSSADYHVRTLRNVLDSDGTLILYRNALSGGSELTYRIAEKHNKPFLLMDLGADPAADLVRRWLHETRIVTLNVAGPRESSAPGIAAAAAEFLARVLAPAS